MTVRLALLSLSLLALAACSSNPPAPVVDRSGPPPRAEIPVDGLHRVHRGDTLHGIAFKYGLDWRDVAAWNNIRSPYTIFPDQIVRLRAPTGRQAARSTNRQVSTSAVRSPSSSTRSAPTTSGNTASSGSRTANSGSTTSSDTARSTTRPAPAPARPAPTPPPSSSPASNPTGAWIWPVDGNVLRSFKDGDPSRNGLDIASREGSAVVAADAGEVVYSGNGLIGYGELVIIKHNERMLSAYGHNRKRLVAEGDRISKGQKIAEVGRNDRNEQILHFEIRRDGKPVDPMGYLPRR